MTNIYLYNQSTDTNAADVRLGNPAAPWGTLSGAATESITATGNLQAKAVLSGAATESIAGTGNLAASGDLKGAATSHIAGMGNLGGTGNLVANAYCVVYGAGRPTRLEIIPTHPLQLAAIKNIPAPVVSQKIIRRAA